MYNAIKNLLNNYNKFFVLLQRDLLHSKCASAISASSISSERSVTGNILSKLISNSLAKLISWSGSEGDKTKFSDTKICEVVFGKL